MGSQDKVISGNKSTYHDANGVVRIDGRKSVRFTIDKCVRQGDSLSQVSIAFMGEVHKICKRRTI